MLQARRSQIVNKITEERMVKASNLMQEFNVSIETIRRDLEYLEKQGYLKRVYGGAVLEGLYSLEPTYEHREIINYDEKKAIAERTAQLINDDDTIFMDVGTTTLKVAHCLVTKKNLTVITNSSLIAHSLILNKTCRVILLGGEMRRGELSVSGFLCDANMQYFHANKAIIGVGGITIPGGITDYHTEEATNRRTMIKRVDKVIAVADYSKFGVTAMNSVCPLSKIHLLVTDWRTSSKVLDEYRSTGLNVCVAPQLA